jgi:hypothetical protein
MIFGKDVAIVKGKTTRKKPKLVIHNTIEVPKALKLAQKDVTLCIDTFFVNKMPFLHTISDKIHSWTLQWVTRKPRCIDSILKWFQGLLEGWFQNKVCLC